MWLSTNSNIRLNEPIKLSMTSRQIDPQERETKMMQRIGIQNRISLTKTPLSNRYNRIYDVKIGIGTPPQYQLVQVDTGSYNLMMSYAKGSNYSSTYWTKNVPMEQWGCTGVIAYDVVTIGGLPVKNQSFWQATNPDCRQDQFTWGISCVYDTLEKMQEVLPNMYKQGLIPQPVFGLYFNPVGSNDTTSSMTLGGVDRTHFIGDITWAPIEAEAWKAKISSIVVGTNRVTINTPNVRGVFDSGTQGMHIYSNFAAQIAKAIGAIATYASDNKTVNGYQGNCNLLNRPENRLTFNVGNAKVTLRPMDYLDNGHNDATVCSFAFNIGKPLPPGEPGELLLGQTFLSNVYSAFDFGNRRIGFAPVLPIPKGSRF